MMQRGLTVAAAAAMLAAGALAATPASAMGRYPANGTYTAIDSVDGSNLTLRIGGNASNARLTLFDDEATIACPVANSAAIARGTGAWVGDDLTLTVRITCTGEPNPADVEVTFTYVPGSDEIVSGGDTYTRS